MNLRVLFNSKRVFLKAILVICCGFCFILSLRAQKIDLRLAVNAETSNQKTVFVQGKLLEPEKFGDKRNWLFLKGYAEATDLAKRVDDLKLYDSGGRELAVRKLGEGEFQTTEAAQSFSYKVLLDVPLWPSSSAHVSWLGADGGLLMLGDVLPQFDSASPIAGNIRIETPNDWRVFGNHNANDASIDIENVEKAVFAVGKNWRQTKILNEKTEINFTSSGNWLFSDDEAAKMATEIFEEYQQIFGASPTTEIQIFLLPFPQKNIQTERWQAETRGSTVTIVSGALTEKRQAIQRLHEQLRHEIFHLWLPNAVNLSGDYSWFYEGFAVYQALKTGVMMNQIRFEDFLNTLADAYNLARNQKQSLLTISARRWSRDAGSVYGKGMIVAFLCDVRLLARSSGKETVADIFREIYQKHHFPNSPQNANQAILAILKSRPEIAPVIADYVEGEKAIEWAGELKSLGIETATVQSGIKLSVAANLNGRQKDLLDKLGYNQWRKLRGGK